MDLSAIGRTEDSQLLAERTLVLTDERKLPQAPAFIACYGALYSAALAGQATQMSRWSTCSERFSGLNQAQQAGYRKFLLQAESLALRQQQRPQEAVARLREAVGSNPDGAYSSHAVQRLQANLAFAMLDAGQVPDAIELLTDVRASLIQRFGPEHISIKQIDGVLSELPPEVRSHFDGDTLASAARQFEARMGRPVDRLRLW
ncbi:MAG: hypothetical protein IPK97_02060 [Ahniella sp.]|nr:hypothetical protein [Ahniella sp.]